MDVQTYGKKFLATVFFISALIPLTSFAQEQRNQTNLGDVLVRFCNDEIANTQGGTKTLELTADAGQEKEICMYISNTGPNDVDVSLNFVDGTVTNDVDQKKACQPEGTVGNFGKYVVMEQRVHTVNAGKTIQTKATVTFPAGVAGMKYGCVTSQIIGQDENDTGMFKVVSRRANFIDILVNGRIITALGIVDIDPSIPNLANSKQILVTQDPLTEEYFAKITVNNEGNVAQQVEITPQIRTRFQAATTGTPMSKKILPGTSETFQFVLDEYIPLWQGNIGVDMNISHHAVIDFKSDAVTEKDKETISFHIITSFFIVPWLLIVGVLILLLLLWIVTNKHNGENDTTTKKNNKPHPSHTNKTTKKKTSPQKDKKDDLTKIEGIGPKIQTLLRNEGIDSYAELAATKIGDIRKLLKENNLSQYDPKHRKKQASLAKDGKWKELHEFKSSL